MSWDSFHERMKWSGRDAALFFAVLMTLCVGGLLASALRLYRYADEFFAVLAIFIAIRICITAKRIKKRHEERRNAPPPSSDAKELSRDELRKARSKLTRDKQISLSQRRY